MTRYEKFYSAKIKLENAVNRTSGKIKNFIQEKLNEVNLILDKMTIEEAEKNYIIK